VTGVISRLRRHPVKGFTPEALDNVMLSAGAHFPGDRLYAVEDGPSGFDPQAPGHISKMKFTVLARLPQIAAVRTRYDDATGVLTASHPRQGSIDADLNTAEGCAAFTAWLAPIVGDDARGELRVITAPAKHRFMDSPNGFVSIINLASVRELAERLGRPVDPARFRANIYIDGWPAWSEFDGVGQSFTIGGATVSVSHRIRRCVATHVDPQTAEVDMDVISMLRENYDHLHFGVYASVGSGGRVAVNDAIARL